MIQYIPILPGDTKIITNTSIQLYSAVEGPSCLQGSKEGIRVNRVILGP